jgi:hypothetical protein
VFRAIHHRPHARVAEATVLYRIRRDNVMWRPLRQFRARGALDMFAWPPGTEPPAAEASPQSERV